MLSVILPQEPCGPGRATALVDLVVIIDTSPSMADEAREVSVAADDAVRGAAASCPSDLRVAWFGVEGVWENTQFTEPYRAYLHRLGVADADITGTPGKREDGGPAIVDISRHFDWRPDAARAIFYLSDEGLKEGSPQDEADVAAANAAIAAAQAAQVKVFTYAGLGTLPSIIPEFARVAQATNGQAFIAPAINLGGFQKVLRDIICGTVVQCAALELPKFGPCFEIRRESGVDDPLRLDDVETMTLVVYNPYANLLFTGLTVFVSLITAEGQPPEPLPDGQPAVFIKPANPICFGDLWPCSLDRPRDLTRLSREVVLVSRGAQAGGYRVKLDYSFALEVTGASEFEVQLVAG